MTRPRWHDVLIVGAIVGLLAIGVVTLWWDDVRGLFHLGPGGDGSGAAPEPIPAANGQT